MPVGSGAREEEEAEAEEAPCLRSSSEPSARRGAQVEATAASRAPTARSDASKFSVSSPGRWKSARPSMRADSTANEGRREQRREREREREREGRGGSSLNLVRSKKIENESETFHLFCFSLSPSFHLSAERDTWLQPEPEARAPGTWSRRAGGARCEASRRRLTSIGRSAEKKKKEKKNFAPPLFFFEPFFVSSSGHLQNKKKCSLSLSLHPTLASSSSALRSAWWRRSASRRKKTGGLFRCQKQRPSSRRARR